MGVVNQAKKVISVDGLEVQAEQARKNGRRIVLCHGCFDIVHPGHVRHLQHAARQGDLLFVTITGDSLISKGSGRPLIPQELRAENLAALDCVDHVAISPHPSAVEVIEKIKPHIYVKGREYERNNDPRFIAEKEAVERCGGSVLLTSGDVVFSSSALIDAISDSTDSFHGRLRNLIEKNGLELSMFENVFESFRGLRVAVIGETIIDTYIMCDRPQVAGEGPILSLRPIEHRRFEGGAAIVARHLAAMGARPTLVTALSEGEASDSVCSRLAASGIEIIRVDVNQPLAEKQRFLVGTNKLVKVDYCESLVLDSVRREQLLKSSVEAASDCCAAMVIDYGGGLFTESLLTEMCLAIRPHVKVLTGDVSGSRSNLLAFRNLDLMCPNESEIRDAVADHNTGLSTVVWRALCETETAAAIIKLGEEGLIAFRHGTLDRNENTDPSSRLAAEHIPAFTPFALDSLGCGDALIAAATLSLAAGSSLLVASIIGSAAAGAEAQQLGNAVIGSAQLRRSIARVLQNQIAFHQEPASVIINGTDNPSPVCVNSD